MAHRASPAGRLSWTVVRTHTSPAAAATIADLARGPEVSRTLDSDHRSRRIGATPSESVHASVVSSRQDTTRARKFANGTCAASSCGAWLISGDSNRISSSMFTRSGHPVVCASSWSRTMPYSSFDSCNSAPSIAPLQPVHGFRVKWGSPGDLAAVQPPIGSQTAPVHEAGCRGRRWLDQSAGSRTPDGRRPARVRGR